LRENLLKSVKPQQHDVDALNRHIDRLGKLEIVPSLPAL